MDIEQTKEQQDAEQRVRQFYANLHIIHSKYYKLYKPQPQSTSSNILATSIATLSHKRKKANQKLVCMKFLKDNRTIILGYDKTGQRGDINFIDASEPKISDFYYNKLQGGLGGIACFEDGRYILVADKKGIFTFVDLSKGPNIDDIKNNSVQTSYEGILDISLSPSQNKIVCGMADKVCLIFDIGKQKIRPSPQQIKKYSGHVYGVNCVNWHPYKSLVLSSSLDIHDSIKLWDPHSEQLVQQINFHNNATVTKSIFHPNGNSFFSLGKDNLLIEYELRFKGYLNKIKTTYEPTALQVLPNGNIVIGDSNGNLMWHDQWGCHLKRIQGQSSVVMMNLDHSNNILAVGRQKEHTFQFYGKQKSLDIAIQ